MQYPKSPALFRAKLGIPIAWFGIVLYNVDIGGEKWGEVGAAGAFTEGQPL
jgi:hypothetical protein